MSLGVVVVVKWSRGSKFSAVCSVCVCVICSFRRYTLKNIAAAAASSTAEVWTNLAV